MTWRPRLVVPALLAAVLLLAAAPPQTARERAERILAEIDDLWRGVSSWGVISMKVNTAHYTRNMRMEAWSKGKERSLVVIMAPLRERGTATLKSGSNIYSYLPKTNRTIRLTAGMMMGSWMGSHFTNDDLVKESRLSEDYDPDITFEGVRGGVEVIEFTLIPKPDAAVVWGKIKTTVRSSDHIPLISYYYDEDMNVVRTMTFSGVTEMGGRRIPAVMRVEPADKPDEFTELVYEKMQFDIDLPDEFFSLARLKRK